jgi:hypothetical protein
MLFGGIFFRREPIMTQYPNHRLTHLAPATYATVVSGVDGDVSLKPILLTNWTQPVIFHPPNPNT